MWRVVFYFSRAPLAERGNEAALPGERMKCGEKRTTLLEIPVAINIVFVVVASSEYTPKLLRMSAAVIGGSGVRSSRRLVLLPIDSRKIVSGADGLRTQSAFVFFCIQKFRSISRISRFIFFLL